MKFKPLMAAAAAGMLLAAAGCGGGSESSQAQPNEPTAPTPPSEPAPEPFVPALFVLGDSLSDTGNAAAFVDYLLGEPAYPEATIGLCHPGAKFVLERDCTDLLYERSRVSDGPVAVEHLAAHAGASPFAPSFHVLPDRPVVGVNYAVAGGKARGTSLRDLEHQVDRLLLDHGPDLPAAAAVVLMIGGNDAIDALQADALPNLEDPDSALPDPAPQGDGGASGSDAGAIVALAIAGIADAASRLLDAGACVIVANVPNLAHLPAVRETAALEDIDLTAALTTAREIATGFNASLAERLDVLSATHAGKGALVPFDLFAAFDTALDAAASDGMNVTDGCFDSVSYTDSSLGERSFHPSCEPLQDQPPRFDAFFFWDGIHPTGAAHAALGSALIETYETGCRGPLSRAVRRPRSVS